MPISYVSGGLVDADDGWAAFDYSMIHPAHGLGGFEASTGEPGSATYSMSEAEKFLASLTNAKSPSSSSSSPSLSSVKAYGSPQSASTHSRSASFEEYRDPPSALTSDDDSSYASSSSRYDSPYNSDSSTETITPSSSISILDASSGSSPFSPDFPFPRQEKSKKKHRRRSPKSNAIPTYYDPATTPHADGIASSEVGLNGGAAAPFRYSPSVHLERISSCYFEPPSREELSAHEALAPLDSALESQIASASSSSSSLPSLAAVSPLTTSIGLPDGLPSGSAAPSPLPEDEDEVTELLPAVSANMEALPSSSSMMIRSYSAPAHTQAQYNALKEKWNAESSAATTARVNAPYAARPRLAHASSSMLSSTSSASSSSTCITASASASRLAPTSPTRPHFSRRATSSFALSSPSLSSDGKQDYSDATLSAAALGPSTPYSSRIHLLSPSKPYSPYKRSRLSYVTEEIPAASSPPRTPSVNGNGKSSAGGGSGGEDPFGTAHTPQTSPYETTVRSKSSLSGGGVGSNRSGSPAYSARPGLNRFFTAPEFFVGGTSGADDEEDTEDEEGEPTRHINQ